MPRPSTPNAIARPTDDYRRVARFGLIVIAITFGAVGLWAAVVPLDSDVSGHGVIVTSSNRQTVEHYEGGIVRQIFVHEGDKVTQGQTLIELNPVMADASLETARNELFSLLAKSDRLSAERAGLPSIRFSPEVLAQQQNPAVAQAIDDESAEFVKRRASLQGEIDVLNTRISEYKTVMQGIDEQTKSMKEQVALLDDELGGLQELYAKDLVPKPRLLAVERDEAQLRGQIGDAISQKAKAEESIGETQLQIRSVQAQFDQDVAKDISDIQLQVADLRQKFAVAQDAAQRISITAPMGGTVQNLRVFTVGGVVRPGEPLLDIAPDANALDVEARFSPTDVDSVHEGQKVQLRFASFHSRTIPQIEGVVRSVSQDRLVDDATHQTYYLAIIDLSTVRLPPELDGKLRAGLPVEVTVPTGTRTALQYALEPLANSLRQSMHEQ